MEAIFEKPQWSYEDDDGDPLYYDHEWKKMQKNLDKLIEKRGPLYSKISEEQFEDHIDFQLYEYGYSYEEFIS